MRTWYMPLFGASAVASVVVSLTSVSTGAQASRSLPTSSAKVVKAGSLRAPDGHPDLGGVWNFSAITPLERPNDLAGKETLTDQEAATLEERAAQNRVDRPPRSGDPGTYNQFWMDAGAKVVPTKRTSLIVDPRDGKLPPLMPDAQRRAAAIADAARRSEGPEGRSLYERCILGFSSGPPMIPGPYNNFVQIFQPTGYVVIFNEMVHDARIVPVDGRPHGTVRQWMGDSRGHWQGDTLIVDTINFTNQGTGTIFVRPPVDENLHLIERFRLTDADTLLYEFTIDDPTIWTKPWTVEVPMSRSGDQLYEYACHEGNYGLEGMLRAARAADKSAAEHAKD
jgi:hypothetical protein